MKVIIASDSYKGSLSSEEVGQAAREAILQKYPDAEVGIIPVADGGEGTVDAVVDALHGERVSAVVSDPLGRPVKAVYGKAGDLAVIESAAACGLTLLRKEERNPWLASTRGVGELIMDALRKGCRRFIIGLGGSATNDGGRGMIETPGLVEAAREAEFTVACDVDTPFIGPDGTSRIFSPQKGATPEMVERLEARQMEYASEIEALTGVDVRHTPGAGAAGGLGGAFLAFLGARLRPGVEIVLDAVGFDDAIRGADLVITGEGRSDLQTPRGKTPAGVLRHAHAMGIPVYLLSGSVASCPELEGMGFSTIAAVTPPSMPIEEAMKRDTAMQNIRNTIHRII